MLSNQIVSAAAIRRYGFSRYYEHQGAPLFYYALPTGGALYGFYLDFVYRDPTREPVQQAAALVGAERVYVVVNEYWKDATRIVMKARADADLLATIGNGRVWILRYDF